MTTDQQLFPRVQLGNWLYCLSRIYECQHKADKMEKNGSSVRYAMLDGMPLFVLFRQGWIRRVLLYDDKIEIDELERYIKKRKVGSKLLLVPTPFPVSQVYSACLLFVACFFEGCDVSFFNPHADLDLDALARRVISTACRLEPGEADSLCPAAEVRRVLWKGCRLKRLGPVKSTFIYDMDFPPFSLTMLLLEISQSFENPDQNREEKDQRDNRTDEERGGSRARMAGWVKPMTVMKTSRVKREEDYWDGISSDRPETRWGDSRTLMELIAPSNVKREIDQWESASTEQQGRGRHERLGDEGTQRELIEPSNVKRVHDHWDGGASPEQGRRRLTRRGDDRVPTGLIDPSDVKVEVDQWESASSEQKRRRMELSDDGKLLGMIEPSDVKIEVDHWESTSLDQ